MSPALAVAIDRLRERGRYGEVGTLMPLMSYQADLALLVAAAQAGARRVTLLESEIHKAAEAAREDDEEIDQLTARVQELEQAGARGEERARVIEECIGRVQIWNRLAPPVTLEEYLRALLPPEAPRAGDGGV